MKFKDKYTFDKTKEEDKDKVQVSVDAYCIGEMVQELINKMEHTRISMMK